MLMSEGMVAHWPFISAWGISRPDERTFERFAVSSPASVLSGRAGGTSWSAPTSRRYWDYGFSDHVEDRGRDHYMKGIEERLAETVGSQVHSGERIGICLSGGHDSRGVLAAIPPTRAHLESVTWGWNPEADGCDAQVARQVAERAGITHRFLPLDPEALPRHASDWVWITDGALEGVYNYPQGADIFRGLATEFDVLIRGDQSFVKWPYGVPDDRVAQAAIGVYPFEWHGIYDALIRPEPLVQLNVAGRRVHEEISARLRSRSSTGSQGRVLLRGASLRKDECPQLSEVAGNSHPQPADRPPVSRARPNLPTEASAR